MITYPLIKFGSSLYATSDNTSTGTRYICTISGLDQFQLSDRVGTQAALDGTRYVQYQAVKDALVTITFDGPGGIDTTKADAIRDVIQTAVTGATTFSLDITADLGTFTFTAKPAENCITAEQSILSGKLANFTVRCYCTD